MTTPEAARRAAEDLKRIRAWHAERSREFQERRLSVSMDTFEAASMVGALLEALAQAQTDLAGAEATAETLRLALEQAEHDKMAYAGALGYPIPGGHDGRHSNGTTPKCGLCEAKGNLLAQAEQRGRAAIQIIQTFYGCSEHVYPREGCIVCDGRRATLDQIIAAIERSWAALTPPEGSA